MKQNSYLKIIGLVISLLLFINGCGSSSSNSGSVNTSNSNANIANGSEGTVYIPSNVKMLRIEPFIPSLDRDNQVVINISKTEDLQQAIDNAVPYTTIVLEDGVYDEIVIRDKQYLTIKSKNKLGATLANKAADNGIQIINSSYITIQDFRVQDFHDYFVFSASWGLSADGSQRLYEPGSHHIYIVGCDVRFQIAGIFSGANSHDWTVDRCTFHELTGSYAWYSLGYHHTLQNSLLYKINNFYMSVRGYIPTYKVGDVIPRISDLSNVEEARLDYGDWTHLIINNTFGMRVDNFSGDLDRGAGVAFYAGGKNAFDGNDPDEDERRYLPAQNVHVENNIFYYNHGGDGIYMNKKYGFDKSDVSHGLPILGTVLKNNITNEQKLITTQYEPSLDLVSIFATVKGSNTPEVLESDLGMKAPYDEDYTLTPDATYLIDKSSRSSYIPQYDLSGKRRGSVVDIGAFEL